MRAVTSAAVFPAPDAPIEIREYPVPELQPDSALLHVLVSEVCGTDVHLHAGKLAGVPYPLIPGHVAAGRLDKVRGTLRDVRGRALREGDLVTFLDVHATCGACWYCLVAKASTRCPSRKVYGITYGAIDGLAGGWAEKLYLKPDTRLIPLDGVDPLRFLRAGCGLPTAIHAVDRAGIALGDTVLVLGAGPVALSLVVCARLRGALRVLVIGAPPGRLEVCKSLGADDVLDFTTTDEAARVEWVRARSEGRGADVTIEATGDPAAVVQALRCTRDAGVVVVAGQYTDHGEVAFNPHSDLNKKHVELRGCWGSDFSHFDRAVRLVRDPRVGRLWDAIPVERYPLARVGEGLARVASGEAVKALVLPNEPTG